MEPLETTALMLICGHLETLIDMLTRCTLRPTPSLQVLYNEITSGEWTDIRDFLALHYKLNTALDTPFWKHCRADTDVSNIAPLLDF